MELKDFIQATLEQIVEGVSNAKENIEKKGAVINPTSVAFRKDGQWNSYEHAMPQEVAFDVGLWTVSTELRALLTGKVYLFT